MLKVKEILYKSAKKFTNIDGKPGSRVAVTGLGELLMLLMYSIDIHKLTSVGLSGVTSVKNLLEQGFDVTGFDQNEYVGGLWKWSADVTQVTVLHSTRANISDWRNSYTDFPFPDDVPNYPSAEQFAKYIDDYAEHFNIKPACRFGVKVSSIDCAKDDQQWEVALYRRTSKKWCISSIGY